MALNRPLFLEATGGDTPFTFSAQEFRTLIDGLVVGVGVSFPSDLAVSQRAAGANFSVDVAAGHAVIAGSSVADQGKYLVQNTATYNVTLTGAPGSGTRFDLVYAQVRDKQADGGSSYDLVIDDVTGTVGAGLPATPANAIPLAQVGPIISTTTSITNALITSLRTQPAAVHRLVQSNDVTASESTASTSFVALTTAGPLLTIPLVGGIPVLVNVSAVASIAGGAGHSAVMGFAVSGQATQAASAANGAETQNSVGHTISRMTMYTPPSTGVYTFTAQYQAVNATSATFANRRLLVMQG